MALGHTPSVPSVGSMLPTLPRKRGRNNNGARMRISSPACGGSIGAPTPIDGREAVEGGIIASINDCEPVW